MKNNILRVILSSLLIVFVFGSSHMMETGNKNDVGGLPVMETGNKNDVGGLPVIKTLEECNSSVEEIRSEEECDRLVKEIRSELCVKLRSIVLVPYVDYVGLFSMREKCYERPVVEERYKNQAREDIKELILKVKDLQDSFPDDDILKKLMPNSYYLLHWLVVAGCVDSVETLFKIFNFKEKFPLCIMRYARSIMGAPRGHFFLKPGSTIFSVAVENPELAIHNGRSSSLSGRTQTLFSTAANAVDNRIELFKVLYEHLIGDDKIYDLGLPPMFLVFANHYFAPSPFYIARKNKDEHLIRFIDGKLKEYEDSIEEYKKKNRVDRVTLYVSLSTKRESVSSAKRCIYDSLLLSSFRIPVFSIFRVVMMSNKPIEAKDDVEVKKLAYPNDIRPHGYKKEAYGRRIFGKIKSLITTVSRASFW